MSGKNKSVELQGSKPRDHEHPRHHFIRRAHKDWRVWLVVILMIALMLVYVLTDDLSFGHHRQPAGQTPAIGAP